MLAFEVFARLTPSERMGPRGGPIDGTTHRTTKSRQFPMREIRLTDARRRASSDVRPPGRMQETRWLISDLTWRR